MTDQAKEARRKYSREWRMKNPEKVKEITRRYWERQGEKLEQEAKQ